MKIVLEIKNTPQKNDILVYNGSEWECVSKDQFLNRVTLLEKGRKQDNETYEKELENLKTQINKKLEEYHKVLQQLVKGDK